MKLQWLLLPAMMLSVSGASFPSEQEEGMLESGEEAEASYEELLKLFLTSFLNVGDLQNAYDVVRRGVTHFPKSAYWWSWYARIAQWLGKGGEAVRAYEELLKIQPSEENIREAFSNYLNIGRYDKALELLSKHPWLRAEIKTLKDLVYIFLQAGKSEELLKVLEKEYMEKRDPEYLYQLTFISYRYFSADRALRYMKELERVKRLSAEDLLLYSEIYIGMKSLEGAYQVLKRYYTLVDPRTEEAEAVEAYYKRLSSLAWIFRDLETASSSAEKLDAMNKAGSPEYVRIYTYYINRGDVKKALEFLARGYERTKDITLLTYYVELLARLAMWDRTTELLLEAEGKTFGENPYLVAYLSKGLYRTGRASIARQILARQLRENFSPEVLSIAIFQAVENNDEVLARFLLKNYSSYEREIPRDFALLYLALQDSQKAIRLMSSNEKKEPDDLMIYAYALDMFGRTEEARSIRQRLVMDLSGNWEELTKNSERLRVYLMAGVGMLSAYHFERAMLQATTLLGAQFQNELLLSHLLSENNHEVVEYLAQRKRVELRPWMELNLALRYNDKDKIRELIEKERDMLPYRDVVEGIRRTEGPNKAMEHAHDSLRKNQEDVLLHKQYRDLVFDFANLIEAVSSYRVWEKVAQWRVGYNIRYAFDRFYILHNTILGMKPDNRNKSFKNLPQTLHAQFAIRRLLERGSVEGGVSYLEGTGTATGLYAGASLYISKKTNLGLEGGYNMPSSDTLYTYFAGLRHYLNLSLSHALSNRTFIYSNALYNLYESQNHKKLGWGVNFYGEVYHKLRVAYPDITFRLFVAGAKFEEKVSDRGDINKISVFENPRVLPKGGFTAGAGFSFGTDQKEMFTRGLSPFLSTEISFNTKAGIGVGIVAGLISKLLGRDSLTVGVNFQRNPQRRTGSFLEPYVRYTLFF